MPGPEPRGTEGSAFAGQLRVVEGADAGREVRIYQAITLGRDPACDLVVNEEEVSRRHLEVVSEDGQAVISDLGSTNGTYIDGERLIDRRQLQDGDRIEVGSAVLEFVAPPSATTKIRAIPAPLRVTTINEVLVRPDKLLTAETSSRKWWTLLVVCGAVFMLLLDTTIVSVALPSISSDLNASFTELQWVVNAYSLILAVTLLTAGSLSDIYGRRLVFAVGLAIFTVMSAVCGLAPSAVVLDLARGGQALGGSMMFATSIALIAQEFPPAERAVAFSAWGATTAIAVAIGPLVGGVLTDGLGWEAIFFVNVPVGILLAIVTLRKLVNLPGAPRKVDVLGAVTFSAAMFMLLLALMRGNDDGWGSVRIVSLLVGAVVLVVVWLAAETRTKDSMLDISLFRKPTFVGAAISSFALGGTTLALIIYITLWLQSIAGYSPLEAGLRLLPITGLALAFSPLAARLSAKVPGRVLVAVGLALVGAGALTMTSIDESSAWTVLLPGLALSGMGIGIATSPLTSAGVGVVPPWQAGMASGTASTFRQLGLATGIAVLGAIFLSTIRTEVTNALADTTLAGNATQFANSIATGGTEALVAGAPEPTRDTLFGAASAGFSAGLGDIFLVAAALSLVAAAAAGLLIRKQDMWTPPGGGEHPAARMGGGG